MVIRAYLVIVDIKTIVTQCTLDCVVTVIIF